MPTSFLIVPACRLAWFRFKGSVDTRDCVDLFTRYTDHPGFDPRFTMLSDTRQLESVDSGFLQIFGAMNRLAPALRRFEDPVLSVIHARSSLIYGMARILQQVAEPLTTIDFHVTRDEAAALETAGLPERDFDTLARRLGTAPDATPG